MRARNPIKLHVVHHKADAVSVTVRFRGREFKRITLQPLRGCTQTEAAEKLEKFLAKLDRVIQLAYDTDVVQRPLSFAERLDTIERLRNADIISQEERDRLLVALREE